MTYTPEEIAHLKKQGGMKPDIGSHISRRIPEFFSEDQFNTWARANVMGPSEDMYLNDPDAHLRWAQKRHPVVYKKALQNEGLYKKTKEPLWIHDIDPKTGKYILSWEGGSSDASDAGDPSYSKKGGQIKKRMKKKRISRKPRGVGKALRGYGKVVKSG